MMAFTAYIYRPLKILKILHEIINCLFQESTNKIFICGPYILPVFTSGFNDDLMCYIMNLKSFLKKLFWSSLWSLAILSVLFWFEFQSAFFFQKIEKISGREIAKLYG